MKTIASVLRINLLVMTFCGLVACNPAPKANANPIANVGSVADHKAYETRGSLNQKEKELALLVNKYRAEQNLPALKVSKNLTFVAQSHVIDLALNNPNKNECNVHSWSKSQSWQGCCYTPDHAQANCMWGKPRELSNYKGNGYEIAYSLIYPEEKKWDGVSVDTNPADVFESWANSPAHNAVISQLNQWKNIGMKSMGIGMRGLYVVIWFGQEEDAEELPLQ